MKKNRIFGVMMAAMVGLSAIAGCSSATENEELTAGKTNSEKATVTATDDKLSVVCTTFSEYDWTREVIGELKDSYDLTILLKDGVDLHSYQPTAEDIYKIANADVFVYVGGASDGWVEDALKEAVNPNMQVINLVEELGNDVKSEKIVEGMESHHHDEEEEHEHEDDEHQHSDEISEETDDHKHDDEINEETDEHQHDDEINEEADEHQHDNDINEEADEHQHNEEEHEHIDEHIWLSLKNTQILVEKIATALSNVDTDNTKVYQDNMTAYVEKLQSLDKEYEDVVKSSSKNTILFGDRFPFRYLADDYGIEYFAAFAGCSAETEASFETVVFLANKIDELGLNTVLVIENSDEAIAKTIIENTKEKKQQIKVLNSLQSITQQDIDNGATYLQVMTDNLEVLKEALN